MSVIQRPHIVSTGFQGTKGLRRHYFSWFLKFPKEFSVSCFFFFFHDTPNKWFFPWRTYHGTTSGVSQNAQFGNCDPRPFLRSILWLHKMIQQVQVLAAMFDHLSFTPETHMMRSEPTSSSWTHILSRTVATVCRHSQTNTQVNVY